MPPGGYLQRLRNKIKGLKYHFVEIVEHPSCVDLEESLAFQKTNAQAICSVLKARFEDNDVVYAPKMFKCL